MSPLHTNIEEFLRKAIQEASEFSGCQQNLSQSERKEISDALLYPLEAGGKRVRPMLLSLIAEACGAAKLHPAVLNCAAAIEFIHTYSLVHDDLPCMDNDDLRRGKPTTHKVYGEANALLVGDGLLTHAFYLIFQASQVGLSADSAMRCVEILSRCSGPFGMIAGQWKDMSHTQSPAQANWSTLTGIHNLKTGALMGAACALGAVTGIALNQRFQSIKETRQHLDNIARCAEELGITLGLAFQIVDDVLDATTDSNTLGKTAGKDLAQDKLTAVRLLGIQEAQTEAQRLTTAALQKIDDLKSLVESLAGDTSAFGQKQDAWLNVTTFVRHLLVRTS